MTQVEFKHKEDSIEDLIAALPKEIHHHYTLTMKHEGVWTVYYSMTDKGVEKLLWLGVKGKEEEFTEDKDLRAALGKMGRLLQVCGVGGDEETVDINQPIEQLPIEQLPIEQLPIEQLPTELDDHRITMEHNGSVWIVYYQRTLYGQTRFLQIDEEMEYTQDKSLKEALLEMKEVLEYVGYTNKHKQKE